MNVLFSHAQACFRRVNLAILQYFKTDFKLEFLFFIDLTI